MTLPKLLASGLGSGLSPVAPGTAGSLLALVLAIPILSGPAWALAVAALGATLIGLWAIPRAGGVDDPGWVVIDEVAGMWITLLGLGAFSWTGLAGGFALFRLLDIWKPGPVGWADRQHGAFGVMADDVIAGGIGALVLWAIRKTGAVF